MGRMSRAGPNTFLLDLDLDLDLGMEQAVGVFFTNARTVFAMKTWMAHYTLPKKFD
jgi:hypothetical protein